MKRPEDDRRMILNPDDWPQWPFLPLRSRERHPGRLPEVAILFYSDRGLMLAKGANLFSLMDEDLKAAKRVNIDEVLNEWEVD